MMSSLGEFLRRVFPTQAIALSMKVPHLLAKLELPRRIKVMTFIRWARYEGSTSRSSGTV